MKTREIALMKRPPVMELALPGSKSITNRALLCAALAKGVSRIWGALDSDDTRVMMVALEKLGVRIQHREGFLEIEGVGGEWGTSPVTLDLGNAGTATRFLTAVLALTASQVTITGNSRMKERPIGDLVEGLRQLGAKIIYNEKESYPPLVLEGREAHSKSREYRVKMKGDKSSQYFSALLFSAPLLGVPVTIEVEGDLVSKPYLDVTLRVLEDFGIRIKNNHYCSFEINPQQYQACDYKVEGDASAATYWTSLALLHGGTVKFTNLGEDSVQGDFEYGRVLRGAMKDPSDERTIDMGSMPDAAMTLAVCAPFFNGKTTITGLSTLRIKETDRLEALKNELEKCGVGVNITPDSITIQSGTAQVAEAQIRTYDDHRMAMCFAILGTKVSAMVIQDPDCVSKTYPNFWRDLESAYLSPLDLGDSNLVITGMRCSGKTYYGRKIATLLKRGFIDLDQEIEKDQGMSVSDLIKTHGWDYFRDIEQKICSINGGAKGVVIATGGGAVLRKENMEALMKGGVNLFLFADPDVLMKRLGQSKSNRPSFNGKTPETEVAETWQERRKLYFEYADVVWDDTGDVIIEGRLPKIFQLPLSTKKSARTN